MRLNTYNGNPYLKKFGVHIQWTPAMMKEYKKCSEDCFYFIRNYVRILDADGTEMLMDLYKYQHSIITKLLNNRMNVVATARQAGKTSSYVAFILWFILFHENQTVALLANKADTAREILGRVQFAYERLPPWLQQGVGEWNKGSMELENGCRVLAGATTKDTFRGYTINLLIIDEAAFVDGWDAFYISAFNTLSSGKKTKILLVSTPNGLNHFWQIWDNAIKDKNDFAWTKVMWSDVPGRDEKWKERILQAMNFNQEQFAQEHEVEFMGSSGTLISGWKLKQLSPAIPLHNKDGLYQYMTPIHGHTYALVADTSEGKGLDYSSFQVIDITHMPFQQVCTYYNNMVVPSEFSQTIHQIASHYNKAYVLVESNNISGQVADLLYNDYEYENLMYTENGGRNGKRLTNRFGPGVERGVRTTKTTKSIGCSMLKLLVEQNQLIINDYHTIYELSRFSKKANTYQAEEGFHDDLTMCLVLFAWMTEQPLFKDLNDINTLNRLRDISEEQMAEQLAPFGFLEDGSSETNSPDGWQVVSEFPGFFQD